MDARIYVGIAAILLPLIVGLIYTVIRHTIKVETTLARQDERLSSIDRAVNNAGKGEPTLRTMVKDLLADMGAIKARLDALENDKDKD